MTDGIYTTGDLLITDHIQDAIPAWAGIKRTSRLLDGSYVLQTIGNPARKLELTIHGDLAAVERINQAESTGEALKVIARGKTWIGYIEDGPVAWSRSAHEYYAATVAILIESETTIL